MKRFFAEGADFGTVTMWDVKSRECACGKKSAEARGSPEQERIATYELDG